MLIQQLIVRAIKQIIISLIINFSSYAMKQYNRAMQLYICACGVTRVCSASERGWLRFAATLKTSSEESIASVGVSCSPVRFFLSFHSSILQ